MKFKAVSSIARIRYRLALALVLAALLPVLVAIGLVETTVRQTSARFFVPEVGEHLDQSLSVYQELARSTKESMQYAATAVANNAQLRRAATQKDREALKSLLSAQFAAFPRLAQLSVLDVNDQVLAEAQRSVPLDLRHENVLKLTRLLEDTPPQAGPLSKDADNDSLNEIDAEDGSPPLDELKETPELPSKGLRLVATFAADKAQFDAFQGMGRFVQTYHKLEHRREQDDQSYVYAFATLLGLTILAAVGVGILLARGVTGRVSALAHATSAAAAGDLTVRVRETGEDEITDLAKGFNRMLAELETSRARIEYLQRMAAWQEMARRLAHEIKNPLTPIQLAVQDIHRRYSGADPAYQQLLDTSLEIVEDEVGTLRRLVTEFSNFARLPEPDLEPADLRAFLQEQAQQLAHEKLPGSESVLNIPDNSVEIRFQLPAEAAPVWLDRQMFRRAFLNLIENARHALSMATSPPQLLVSLKRDADFWQLTVEDSGPGIPEALSTSLFDPYVTTKSEGAGLGLAIVKKIVIDHGGRIAQGSSRFGGAKLSIWLPAQSTHAQESFLASRKQPSRPAHSKAEDLSFKDSLEPS